MAITLQAFETLADAHLFRTREGEMSLPNNATIRPIGDELCNGRSDCRVCARLVEGIESETHKLLFLPNDLFPSFALCNRGSTPDAQKLLTVVYEYSPKERTRKEINFGSTMCPREHGEHALV